MAAAPEVAPWAVSAVVEPEVLDTPAASLRRAVAAWMALFGTVAAAVVSAAELRPGAVVWYLDRLGT